MLIRMLLICTLASCLAACGGKQDTAETAPAPAPVAQDEPAKDEAPDEGSSTGDPDDAAPAGNADPPTAVSVMSDMVTLLKAMASVVDAAGGDCDKMAAGLDELIVANHAKLEVAKRFSDDMKARMKDDPEVGQKAMEELAPYMSDLMTAGMKLGQAMQTCGENENMQAVQAKWQKYQ